MKTVTTLHTTLSHRRSIRLSIYYSLIIIMTSSNLKLTISNAIDYLTHPLLFHSSPTTILKLQLLLDTNLTAFYAPTWIINNPLSGSGRRCLTLSPTSLPPRPIYAACLAAGVNWFDWFPLLATTQFDFFVDPGCVSVRYGKKGLSPIVTVWSDESITDLRLTTNKKKKTVAQELMEHDAEEDEELFAMLADEIAISTWITPIVSDSFPLSARSISPLSEISVSSFSSSSSSSSSSSYPSLPSSPITPPSALSSAPLPQPVPYKMSRREQARRERIFVDSSKREVTPYDGGKTTVLTGGVMLGGPPKPPTRIRTSSSSSSKTSSDNWRSIRS